MNLEGKTIVVTGASSGIGRAIAIHLSRLGAKCALIGRDEKRLEETKAACASEAFCVPMDFTDFAAHEPALSQIVERLGPVFGFVHSAGIEQTVLLQFVNPEQLRQIFELNVYSAIQFSGLLTKKKYRTEQQSLVFISSIMGIVGNKGLTAYSATKGALIAMVRSMALELASKQVRVNAISPGHIADSGMTAHMESTLSAEALQKIEENHPLGLGKCEDVAASVAFLLSDGARWITGQNLVVDGGYSIR
ncbi:SDR family NAD(P)-dependent oxidoreductase [Flavobacterium silvaticum]|uniref:SDR family oxidoreductase n=1 Tax=Flavobacterium silvaticum TaxID=1852020 RepID=A0A972JKU8_9FLAO|nr:SDR family NAD(P)-dependent oxidoreductase [Flavobacterium silvaticum]NMH29502.1 SDR family oxidoreductase [Flavobacterium silvaticum]